MIQLDNANVNVSKKSNEQNIMALNSTLAEVIDAINYLSVRIDSLESKKAESED